MDAGYWFVSAKGGWKSVSIKVDAEVKQRFLATLDTISTEIAEGVFPANPGPEDYFNFENCKWCEYDRICPADRDRAWLRLQNAPALAALCRARAPPPVSMRTRGATMSDERPPLDDDVRVTVATDLDRTLFVEAGAGSGKTTVLVSRVCALVESGVDLTKIAAITFTEKAAAELRVRVREELRRRPPSPLIERALASLGDAPMSTLHSFARRILTEHGLAVGVPPRFELLDEVGEAIYLENQWRHLASRLFDPDGELSDVVARAVELGHGHEAPP